MINDAAIPTERVVTSPSSKTSSTSTMQETIDQLGLWASAKQYADKPTS